MNKFTLCGIILVITLTGCSNSFYQKMADGIIVPVMSDTPDGAKNIRLQVVNEKIIRVTATADKKFSGIKSLMVVPQTKPKTKFDVEEKDDRIILMTDSLQVSILKKTGEISFLNKRGEVILQETAKPRFEERSTRTGC